MSATIVAEVNECGFAIARQYIPDDESCAVFSRLGRVQALPGVPDVHTLAPRAHDESTPNTYSGNYGWGEFPLHTDLAHWCIPPRYIALRCVIGAATVATRLLDGSILRADLGERALRRALVQPRRPVGLTRPIFRLLENLDGKVWMLRWDSLFIAPATEASVSIYDAVKNYVSFSSPVDVLLTSPGDTLIVDNWRMLHGRSAVSAAFRGRRIDRAYLGEIH